MRSGPKTTRKISEKEDLKNRKKLLKKYGLTLSDFGRMMALQDSRCKICGDPPPDKCRLSVDHDHKTGAVRALLCLKCNSAVAMCRDNPKIALAVVNYLLAFGY